MSEKSNNGLKWTIGIIAFIVHVWVVRNVITDGGILYEDHEPVMSTGESWLIVLWTILVVFVAVKVYKALTKE